MKDCKYCQQVDGLPLPISPNFAEVNIVASSLEINYDAYSVDSSFTAWIEINFCPMCGRDLNKE